MDCEVTVHDDRSSSEPPRMSAEDLDGDRLVELTVEDLDELAERASADHGSVRVEGVDDGPGPLEDEVEIVVGEPVEEAAGPDAAGAPGADRAGGDDEPLTNADFGGSDELVLPQDRVVEVLPDIARLAAIAATRSAAWGLGAGLRATRRLVRASVDPQAAVELVEEIGDGVRGAAREFLGVSSLEARVDALTPAGDRITQRTVPSSASRPARRQASRLSPEEVLRIQGAELLRQSADVHDDQHLHPAFGRILGELAPDEGRIIRLLLHDGPQPVVDVRAVNLIGVGSQLVAANLSMVAMQAGLRHHDRVPAYLVNLERLGLVEFSDQAIDDAMAYQVLEAQPQVMERIQNTSRAKTSHRSLRLTPFGTTFAEVCFPIEIEDAPALTSPKGEGQKPSVPAENDEFGS